jgi:predicted glycogen debranching enzyme
MTSITFGPQVCGSLAEATSREWLVTDGLGGFAMGTVAGLRTRRYHGLLVVATAPPIGRMMALSALDAELVIGDRRVRLATHEWADGTLDPVGYRLLQSFALHDGVPTWTWQVGDTIIRATLAMAYGASCVMVRYDLVAASGPVRLHITPQCTWRDVHGDRFAAGDPAIEATADGFVFEGAYRVVGPNFAPGGSWYRGVYHREEAARGLGANEDTFAPGSFWADLNGGESCHVAAWSGLSATPPADLSTLVDAAKARFIGLGATAKVSADADRLLVHAADQFIVGSGPTVVAGYPWFGAWSRDTLTSYEGLFLCTGRAEEGRRLLLAMATSVKDGLVPNTSDVGGAPTYNTADASLWFIHALDRHVAATGDRDLFATTLPVIAEILGAYRDGTNFGIGAGDDGLVRAGDGVHAVTWMDAVVGGHPVTPRQGGPVEINALWVNALRIAASLDPSWDALANAAHASFVAVFDGNGPIPDVIDSGGVVGVVDRSVRPNALLAASLPHGPLVDRARPLADSMGELVTPLGLRTLSPDDPDYRGAHRGDMAERDRAYHQGTVWPWLIGPYLDVRRRAGMAADGLLDGLTAHLYEAGLGSVSECADGDPPHGPTGCPFQAWSVAEVLRARTAARH